MKNVYILGGVLLLVAVAGYWYQSQSIDKFAKSETNSTTVERAILTPLSADVEMTSLLDQEAWKVISDVSEVEDGAGVRTSAAGRAVIANDQEIITSLNNNSQIRLSLSPDKKQTRIELVAGETWSKIGRALEQDEVYEVYTPTMVAAVRGTSFGVSLNAKKSLVVTEGTVLASQRNRETGEIKPNSTVPVPAGSTLEDDGQTFTVRDTVIADKDEWYVANNPNDNSAKKTAAPKAETESSSTVTPPPISNPTPATNTPEVVTPPTEIVTKLKIDNIDPDEFVYGEVDRITIHGDGLAKVTRVEFNGDQIDFIVTNQGVLGVNAADLPNQDEVYDITFITDTESITVKNAVEVVESESELVLEIDQVLEGGNSSNEEFFLRVIGTGMDLVDEVLLDGQMMEFGLFSDTELHVFDTFYVSGMTVKVSGEDLSDSYILP